MRLLKFTLIELLVVIAIIGILASMLLPSLAIALEKSKIAVCISNLKQLSLAINLYADDHNSLTPNNEWYADMAGPKGKHHWGRYPERRLNPYIGGDTEVFETTLTMCPSDKGESMQKQSSNYSAFGSSYVVQHASSGNINIGKISNIGNPLSPLRIDSWDEPAAKISFFDETLFDNRPWDDERNRWHKQQRPNYPVAFMDGHAKYFYFWWKASGSKQPGGSTSGAYIGRDGYY